MIVHLCPVCQGRGFVPLGFYSPYGAASTANDETCRTCKGTGVLWEQPHFNQFDMSTPLDAAKRYWEKR